MLRHLGARIDGSIEEETAGPTLRYWLIVQLMLSAGAWGVIVFGISYLV
jgi:hypothetical protein